MRLHRQLEAVPAVDELESAKAGKGKHIVFVNPREYRAFCFRGEGRKNIVISAKNERTGQRIVWRFAKARKSGLLNVAAKCDEVSCFMSTYIAPLLDPAVLLPPRTVHWRVQDVHQLAKIPALPPNYKVSEWGELCAVPAELSFLPLETARGVEHMQALEMPDATRIPKQMHVYHGPTITVELKPKQGFYQCHPGVELPHCNNCILQLEKSRSADVFSHMYDFCPLDLFSGERERMRAAIDALIDDPHRNLRLFVDGDVLHSDEAALERSQLGHRAFPMGGPGAEAVGVDELVSALMCVLSGHSCLSEMPEKGCLKEEGVLSQILRAQLHDDIGIVRAHAIWKALSDKEQCDMKRAWGSGVGPRAGASEQVAALERYLLAATIKDCSVMLSLRLVPSSEADRVAHNVARVGKETCFAYSVKIVDLDPKSPKNLVNAFARFETGCRLIRATPTIHKACV